MTGAPQANDLLKRGLSELGAGRIAGAIATFEEALRLEPDFLAARKALTRALFEDSNFKGAVAVCEDVIAAEPGNPANYLNYGLALLSAGRPAEAAENLTRGLGAKQAGLHHRFLLVQALMKAGDEPGALAAMEQLRAAGQLTPEANLLDFELRHMTCAWGDYPPLLAAIKSDVARGLGTLDPSTVLAAPGLDGADHRKLSQAWAARIARGILPMPAPAVPATSKIRVGYISPDLQQKHPIGRHLHPIVKCHDRSSFSVHAYSLRPAHKLSASLYDAYDSVTYLDTQGDGAAAEIIRNDGIEILVDVGGYTNGSRPQILARRPAPLQVHFMGHGGTTGASFFDYLMADDTVAPPASHGDFTEALAMFPGSFFSGAWERPAMNPIKRSEFGIDEDAFVFCAFSNNYKITLDIFDLWMDLLKAVPQSVLWLRDKSAVSSNNLRRRVAAAGLPPERVLFAKDVPPESFFGRLACGDLYLDTTPYSAGSSAADALWAGLPVLALAGESFIARMSASIVNAGGLAELIAPNRAAYFAKAKALAEDRDLIARYRKQLLSGRGTNPLFDAAAYTRDLETLFRKMSQRYRAGAPPALIRVSG